MSKVILHLDDEPAIREILAAYLTQKGYRVVSAETPTEALQAIGKEHPDLIITDLQLGDGDGLETVDQMRTAQPGVPIILLTGVLIDPRVARQSLANKVDAYLQKTLPLQKLSDEIDRLLNRGS